MKEMSFDGGFDERINVTTASRADIHSEALRALHQRLDIQYSTPKWDEIGPKLTFT